MLIGDGSPSGVRIHIQHFGDVRKGEPSLLTGFDAGMCRAAIGNSRGLPSDARNSKDRVSTYEDVEVPEE